MTAGPEVDPTFMIFNCKIPIPFLTEIKQCYYPRLMDHGTVDDLYVNAKPSGEEATFRCHDGFKLVGQAKLTCNGKKWSAKAPTCTCEYKAYLADSNKYAKGILHPRIYTGNKSLEY